MDRRRIRVLSITARFENLLPGFSCNQVLFGGPGSVNLFEITDLVRKLVGIEKLPRDVVPVWCWWQPDVNCCRVLLWSEHFSEVPEGEMAPSVFDLAGERTW